MTEQYPQGIDDREAPFNREPLPEKEIELLVSITLSKSIKVKVNDYKVKSSGKDEDGDYSEVIDYSECDLADAVSRQVVLPFEAGDFLEHLRKKGYITVTNPSLCQAVSDLSGWHVDEFEAVKER